MSDNADRFLSAYNRIEKRLDQLLVNTNHQAAYHRSFPDLVRRAAEVSAAVRQYEADLREYGELRNAIVHGATKPETVIADPHPDVVERIERIAREVSEPDLVLPRFAKRVVYVLDNSPFSAALDLIAERGFSQLPVFGPGNDFRGLLTETGIARWLASSRSGGPVSLDKVLVTDVLRYEEPKYNWRFVSPETEIYEALEIFAANKRRDQQKVKALLITRSGLAQLPLLGIITPWDLVDIYRLQAGEIA